MANWLKLDAGKHAGETLPQVMLDDPLFVLDGFEAGLFKDDLLAQAAHVIDRTSRVRVPRDADEDPNTTVFYRLLPDESFGGYSVVPKSDPKYTEYARFAAAQSEGLDVSLAWMLAPGDDLAAAIVMNGIKHMYFGHPKAVLTRAECEAFFEDAANFLD